MFSHMRVTIGAIVCVVLFAISSANAAAASASGTGDGSGGPGSQSGHMGCQGDQWGHGLHKGKANQTSNSTIPVGITLSCLLDILQLDKIGNTSTQQVLVGNGSVPIFVTELNSSKTNLIASLLLSSNDLVLPSVLRTSLLNVTQSGTLVTDVFTNTTYNLAVRDKDLANDTTGQVHAHISAITASTVVTSINGPQVIPCPTCHWGGGGGTFNPLIVEIITYPGETVSGFVSACNSAPAGNCPYGYGTPTATVTPSVDSKWQEVPTQFSAIVFGGSGSYAYQWTFQAPAGAPIGSNVVHYFNQGGVFTIYLTVTDTSWGYTTTASMQVTVNVITTQPNLQQACGGWPNFSTGFAGWALYFNHCNVQTIMFYVGFGNPVSQFVWTVIAALAVKVLATVATGIGILLAAYGAAFYISDRGNGAFMYGVLYSGIPLVGSGYPPCEFTQLNPFSCL